MRTAQIESLLCLSSIFTENYPSGGRWRRAGKRQKRDLIRFSVRSESDLLRTCNNQIPPTGCGHLGCRLNDETVRFTIPRINF